MELKNCQRTDTSSCILSINRLVLQFKWEINKVPEMASMNHFTNNLLLKNDLMDTIISNLGPQIK